MINNSSLSPCKQFIGNPIIASNTADEVNADIMNLLPPEDAPNEIIEAWKKVWHCFQQIRKDTGFPIQDKKVEESRVQEFAYLLKTYERTIETARDTSYTVPAISFMTLWFNFWNAATALKAQIEILTDEDSFDYHQLYYLSELSDFMADCLRASLFGGQKIEDIKTDIISKVDSAHLPTIRLRAIRYLDTITATCLAFLGYYETVTDVKNRHIKPYITDVWYASIERFDKECVEYLF